jgi:hypothetical protein
MTITHKDWMLRVLAPVAIAATGVAMLVATLYHDLPGFLSAMFLR